mmetsp:Transcript_10618/g.12177  ORF Transcript_10618/g.12177 Transcript_10618/m.12177 type:complete len:300 (+) Transcript_10618:58-957(+)
MGVYLTTPNKEKHSEEGKHLTMKYGATGMQGWRKDMEDAHIAKYEIAPDVHIFGVFDGHGGKEVAKFVASHFVEELTACDAFKSKNYEKALVDTFLKMDVMLASPAGVKEINQIRSEDGKSDYMESQAGCTANVALVAGKTLYCANAGDSRCVLSSKGQAIEMSYDHKPENDKERARIEKIGGSVIDGRVNGNLNLSRAIGDLEYKRTEGVGVGEQLIIAVPDVKKKDLTSDDEFIVMGCDGIWEVKPNQAIVDFVSEGIKKGTPLTKIAEDLVDSLLAKDTANGIGCDNMTCIIATLN